MKNRFALFSITMLFSVLTVGIWQQSCTPSSQTVDEGSAFEAGIDLGLIVSDELDEISGIETSSILPDVFWVHNDSGDKPRLFAVNKQGQTLAEVWLENAINRDWEDITAGPGPEPGKYYLYVGETGDNVAAYPSIKIYRFIEPDISSATHESPLRLTISQYDTLSFVYPDGRRDAEAIMLDPLSKDLYIVSKREPAVRVYKAPFPQDPNKISTLQLVGGLDMTMVTAADISANGNEVLVKNYQNIFYWQLPPTYSEGIGSFIVNHSPEVLPYAEEPQGEAICWSADGQEGYYTTSEERNLVPARLIFYSRIRH